MPSKKDAVEEKLDRKYRRTAHRLPSTILLTLIVAAALLNFLPMRVTFAAGSTLVDQILGPGSTSTLLTLSGTHITLDSPSNFMNTTTLNQLLKSSLGNSISTIYAVTKRVDFLALKAETITLDIGTKQSSSSNGTKTILELRIVLSSLTVSGYNINGQAQNRYNETTLTGLNPTLVVTLDRVFLDLFIDPSSNVALYVVSADMTVYQGLAFLLEGAIA